MTRALVVFALTLGAATALAQGRYGFGFGKPVEPNAPYDGTFTFVRLRYGPEVEIV